MTSLRIALIGMTLAACQDERPTEPITPPPVQQGVAAFVTVDNPSAAVGQTVRVRVEVQVGTQQAAMKIGSFTGRLRFDPARLAFRAENAISDGLRVANAAGAGTGEIRFAGANPGGFNTLVLYDATFVVRAANFREGLTLTMEELSTALTLTDLNAQLRVSPQVFTSRVAN